MIDAIARRYGRRPDEIAMLPIEQFAFLVSCVMAGNAEGDSGDG